MDVFSHYSFILLPIFPNTKSWKSKCFLSTLTIWKNDYLMAVLLLLFPVLLPFRWHISLWFVCPSFCPYWCIISAILLPVDWMAHFLSDIIVSSSLKAEKMFNGVRISECFVFFFYFQYWRTMNLKWQLRNHQCMVISDVKQPFNSDRKTIQRNQVFCIVKISEHCTCILYIK